MATVAVANPILLQILNQLRQDGSVYNPAYVMLWTNDVAFTPATILADLDEATFSGYARSSAVNWLPPFYAPDGIPTLTGDLKLFIASAPFSVAETVYGWAAIGPASILTGSSSSSSSGPLQLLFGKRLDVPIIIAAAGQAVEVLPTVPAFQPS